MSESFNIFNFSYLDPTNKVKKEDLGLYFAYGFLLNPPYDVLNVRIQILGTSPKLEKEFFKIITDSTYPFSLNSSSSNNVPQFPHFPQSTSNSGDLAARITNRISLAINKTIKIAESKLADTKLFGLKIPRDEGIDKKKIREMVLSRLPSIDSKIG